MLPNEDDLKQQNLGFLEELGCARVWSADDKDRQPRLAPSELCSTARVPTAEWT